MKLLFGLIGCALVIAFLVSFVIKVKAMAMIVVATIGVLLMLIDAWQSRNE